jgi:hypothetical protein
MLLYDADSFNTDALNALIAKSKSFSKNKKKRRTKILKHTLFRTHIL